ncbi:MAG: type II toxin-antitoxin system VapC family toxin [Candidatus Methylomirabilis oxyfera]|nr:type II toxin-antitoxin system VapC family toxin [Candidatus Methylomirabilis oxyfera]
MILLDTHAWVWWATSSPNLSKNAVKAIRAAQTLHVSAISCWEVATLAAKGRLVFDRDVEVWLDLALRFPGVELVPLSPRIAVRSSRLEKGFLGDPADRIIVATALEHGCAIVSKDERIRSYPRVRVTW